MRALTQQVQIFPEALLRALLSQLSAQACNMQFQYQRSTDLRPDSLKKVGQQQREDSLRIKRQHLIFLYQRLYSRMQTRHTPVEKWNKRLQDGKSSLKDPFLLFHRKKDSRINL